ncbi:MAG: YkvA family protein [Bacteroidales bacterium]
MNQRELIDKFGKGRKVSSSDKGTFFKILQKFFSISDLEVLWHIVTMKNTKCVKKIFGILDLALITGAVAYVVFPLDSMPDFIPVVGWLDDVGVIGFILNNLGGKIIKYRKQCM